MRCEHCRHDPDENKAAITLSLHREQLAQILHAFKSSQLDEQKLRRIPHLLDKLRRILMAINDKLDQAIAEASEETTIADSLDVIMDRIIADLTAAKGSEAKVDTVIATLRSNKARFAAAVAKGVEADPAITPSPEETPAETPPTDQPA